MDPLLDNEFLKELFSQNYRETYARVISLNIDEEPLEELQGRITQGNANLDGNSSLRRTCNLTFTCNYETSINDYYWTVKTKFKLLLGLKNYINSDYPEIIWFKLGTYVITSFSYNYSTSGMSISLSGKDKMCLINGDVGGQIYASVDFGTREEVDSTTGLKELVDINIEDIIREAVHEYGHEPWENIIIKDLPKYGLFLLEWTGDTPIYVLLPTDGSDETAQAYINEDIEVYVDGVATKISELQSYLTTNELTLVDKSSFTVVKTSEVSDATYFVCRILPGQSAGYDVTELTYPRNGEESGLITSVGESVTSVLDKIVDFLGNYEYFFNVDGQFIFQKKNKWTDTNWNSNDFDATGMGNDYTLISILNTSWMFEGSELVTSFNNSPNIGNIKNDFSIWGEKQSGEETYPIHMRYAVDKKPVFYKSVSYTSEELTAFKKLHPEFVNMKTSEDWPSVIYYTDECPEEYVPVGAEVHKEDWRELIYQMALDYRRFNHFDTFNARVLQANTVPNAAGGYDILYPKGITGYEQYYVDLEGFWRYLYRPEYDEGMILGYSIKNGNEIDTEKEVYTRDHWFNAFDKELGGEQKEYYATYYTSESDITVPVLVENPKRINVKDYLERNLMVFENYISSNDWFEGGVHEEYNNELVYYPPEYNGVIEQSVIEGGAMGIYYDNGAVQDLYYNKNNYLINEGYEYRTEKYNLLLNYREDVALADLEAVAELEYVDTNNNDFSIYNTYTIYKVDDEYYIFDRVKNERTIPPTIYFELRRVQIPLFSGIKYFDTGEQVYRAMPQCPRKDGTRCYYYSIIHSKVGILKTLPSTFTYLSFKGPMEHTGLPDGDYLEAAQSQVYNHFTDKPLFNFDSNDDFEKSAVYLSQNNNSFTKLSEEPSYVNALMKYGSDDYWFYYTYINADKKELPILDEHDNYTYKHESIAYYQETYEYSNGESYGDNKWNALKNESPELLLFWFDFLDSQTSEIGKYGVNNAMDRSKASNESNVKAIYYRDTLNIVYQRIGNISERYQKLLDYTRSGYNIIQAGNWVWDYFKVANCGKSCKDVLDEWLQAYTQANESVSISCIPIYILEPNNRITIHDDNIKINGEYVINSLSIPLTFNGTMNINATKAVDKLY